MHTTLFTHNMGSLHFAIISCDSNVSNVFSTLYVLKRVLIAQAVQLELHHVTFFIENVPGIFPMPESKSLFCLMISSLLISLQLSMVSSLIQGFFGNLYV